MSEDAHTDRERILAMAKAAATLPEPYRRQAVMGLMRERYRVTLEQATAGLQIDPPCTEAEVFYAGYGDATGREYWSAWLFPGKATADQLAWLIATHASCSAEEFERVRKQLEAGLAAIADQPARAMVEHLIADPDTGRFVPPSLRAYLELGATPACPVGAVPAPGIAQKPPGASPVKKKRKSPQRDRVKAEMRAEVEAGNDVFEWSETAMEAQFKACRDVCRRALGELKAESPIVGIVGRQRPTVDK